MTNPESTPDSSAEQNEAAGMRCDFCGQEVASVRRVALDGDYERLRTPHQVQYACPSCSEKKESQRIGLEHD
jgi:hypothetical protein